MIKVSAIIPLHNQEIFVLKCLSSLFEQDLLSDEYEIIVIDDCSTDNSADIALDFIKEFPSARLYKLERNIKQGGARNFGLRHAKGEYVWFIDSDDYICPNSLKSLLSLCNKDLDVLCFNYWIREGDDLKLCPDVLQDDGNIHDGLSFFTASSIQWWKTCVSPWQRIVRRKFLIDNNIFFEENVQYEDPDYAFKLFALAKHVRYAPIAPYVYRKHSASVTNSKVTSLKLVDWIKLIERMQLIVKKKVSNNALWKKQAKDFIGYTASSVKKEYFQLPTVEQEQFQRFLSNHHFFGWQYLSLSQRLFFLKLLCL